MRKELIKRLPKRSTLKVVLHCYCLMRFFKVVNISWRSKLIPSLGPPSRRSLSMFLTLLNVPSSVTTETVRPWRYGCTAFSLWPSFRPLCCDHQVRSQSGRQTHKRQHGRRWHFPPYRSHHRSSQPNPLHRQYNKIFSLSVYCHRGARDNLHLRGSHGHPASGNSHHILQGAWWIPWISVFILDLKEFTFLLPDILAFFPDRMIIHFGQRSVPLITFITAMAFVWVEAKRFIGVWISILRFSSPLLHAVRPAVMTRVNGTMNNRLSNGDSSFNPILEQNAAHH